MESGMVLCYKQVAHRGSFSNPFLEDLRLSIINKFSKPKSRSTLNGKKSNPIGDDNENLEIEVTATVLQSNTINR